MTPRWNTTSVSTSPAGGLVSSRMRGVADVSLAIDPAQLDDLLALQAQLLVRRLSLGFANHKTGERRSEYDSDTRTDDRSLNCVEDNHTNFPGLRNHC